MQKANFILDGGVVGSLGSEGLELVGGSFSR